ncbi:MAG: VWA domain-containing protein [Candidatus Eisenbacteria bacterium]|jgi:Ca-activated chloride channel family protein|nr:VWA domain-containing protein [Candidatus Eisenbacteria bacterium]
MEAFFRFLRPGLAALLFCVPAYVALRVWAARRTVRRVELLASIQTRWRIAPRMSPGRRFTAVLLLAMATTMLAAAAMRPQGDPSRLEVLSKGRDLVFLVDVSRSMLAQDLRPSRLERSVLAIKELIPSLKGDRVALVVFAGNAALKSPLTLDYTFLRSILDELGPSDVSQGGTSVGDALRITADRVLKAEEAAYQDIILISDGEDQDSFALEAAKELAVRGVRIHAVGVGSLEGTRIPDPDSPGAYLTYQGETVHSALNEELLRRIAEVTPGGSYLPARAGNLELVSLYRDVISQEEERTVQTGMRLQWREWFQAPLLLGILLLAGEAIVRGTWNA